MGLIRGKFYSVIGFLALNALSLFMQFLALWALSVGNFISLARDLALNALLSMVRYSWVSRTLSLDLKVACVALIYIVVTG